jgi:hypothetical protein
MTAPDEFRDDTTATDEPIVGGTDLDDEPLLLGDSADLTSRWDRTQAMFVDDPRQAVQEARELVEDVLGRLAGTFDTERGKLEAAWEAGEEPSTEDLRQALRRYRAFFERLLSV